MPTRCCTMLLFGQNLLLCEELRMNAYKITCNIIVWTELATIRHQLRFWNISLDRNLQICYLKKKKNALESTQVQFCPFLSSKEWPQWVELIKKKKSFVYTVEGMSSYYTEKWQQQETQNSVSMLCICSM